MEGAGIGVGMDILSVIGSVYRWIVGAVVFLTWGCVAIILTPCRSLESVFGFSRFAFRLLFILIGTRIVLKRQAPAEPGKVYILLMPPVFSFLENSGAVRYWVLGISKAISQKA